MIRLLSHYIPLFKSGELLDAVPRPVLVWHAPATPSESTREVTAPKSGMRRPKSGDALVFELISRQPGQGVLVGRSSSCDIKIADDNISRKHVLIAPAGKGWTVSDLGSRNGTWIGMNKLSPHTPMPLADGARLQLGNIELFFMLPTSFKSYLSHLGSPHN